MNHHQVQKTSSLLKISKPEFIPLSTQEMISVASKKKVEENIGFFYFLIHKNNKETIEWKSIMSDF